MEKITQLTKVTIQILDTEAPYLNTNIVEIEDIPLDNNEIGNLINFLLKAKEETLNTEEEKTNKGPSIILPGDK